MSQKKKVVLVSAWPPTRFHAGGQRQLDLYAYLQATGKYELSLYSRHLPSISDQIDTSLLNNIFDNVYLSSEEELTGEELTLMSCEDKFDVVDVQHMESAIRFDSFKSIGNRIIYTPMESEIRNLAIRAKKLSVNFPAIKLSIRERQLLLKSDFVVSVSKPDESFLKIFANTKTVRIDTPISRDFILFSKNEKRLEFEARSGVVFVAYFGSQTNIDSLDWYIKNVHEQLLKIIPDIQLNVIGDRSEQFRESCKSRNVNFMGRVPEVIPYIAKSRVAIAPALYGSGFRGKINQYSILGIPTVAHPLSAIGLNYPKGSLAISSSSSEWIKNLSQLYLSQWKNEEMARMSAQHSLKFTLEAQAEKLSYIYD
jgi:hypothetical protein